jgi:hypothetical protein
MPGARGFAPGGGAGHDIKMSRMIAMRDGMKLEYWILKPSHLEVKAPQRPADAFLARLHSRTARARQGTSAIGLQRRCAGDRALSHDGPA